MSSNGRVMEQPALLRNGPGKVRMGAIPMPTVKNGEVLVKVEVAGVCGSDIARYRGSDALDKPLYDEIAFGHEFTGEVVEVGPETDQSWMGKRVAVAPLIPDHDDEFSKAGHFAQCGKYSFIGSRESGAFTSHVAVPAINLVELPPELSYKAGALIEPLANVLHPMILGDIIFGDGEIQCYEIRSIAVLGQGAIGLLATQASRALFGDKVKIIATATNDQRLEMSRQLGADYVVNIKSTNLVDEVKAGNIPTAELVIECAGAQASIQNSYEIASNIGTILQIGKPTSDVTFTAKQFEMLLRKQLTVIGSFQSHSNPWPGDEWRLAAKLLAEGKINVDALIEEELNLEQAVPAIQAILDGKSKPIKSLLFPN